MTAANPRKKPVASVQTPAGDLPADCIWMVRQPDDGAPQFAAVHRPSGSVDAMRELGWAAVEVDA